MPSEARNLLCESTGRSSLPHRRSLATLGMTDESILEAEPDLHRHLVLRGRVYAERSEESSVREHWTFIAAAQEIPRYARDDRRINPRAGTRSSSSPGTARQSLCRAKRGIFCARALDVHRCRTGDPSLRSG